MVTAIHTNLYYDDGTQIATGTYHTVVDDPIVYTQELAAASGASWASTLIEDEAGEAIVYASYDGSWKETLR